MPDDPFYTSVVLQLMRPPQASLDALAAARIKAPPVPPELAFDIQSARSWAVQLLQAGFQPKLNDLFLPFPNEAGRFDVIRCAYRADSMDILIGESKYAISIGVTDPRFSHPGQDREKAESLARQLLTMPERIRLKETGVTGNRRYGEQDVKAAGSVDPQWPHWLDALHWWSEANSVGFVTVKASGGPTRAVISLDDQSNRHWF